MLKGLPVYDKNRVSKLISCVHFVLKFPERLSSENLSIIAHWVGGERRERMVSLRLECSYFEDTFRL